MLCECSLPKAILEFILLLISNTYFFTNSIMHFITDMVKSHVISIMLYILLCLLTIQIQQHKVKLAIEVPSSIGDRKKFPTSTLNIIHR